VTYNIVMKPKKPSRTKIPFNSGSTPESGPPPGKPRSSPKSEPTSSRPGSPPKSGPSPGRPAPSPPPKSRTLGPVSAKFVRELTQQGKTIFTLKDGAEVYKKSERKISKFVQSLIKRGILVRLGSGKYMIQQMGYESVQMTNWAVIARELIEDAQYFISHYSAMRLHGMTTHPIHDIYITVTKRVRTKSIGGITYHFIYSKKEHFWGWESQWVSKHEKVILSDIERTLLDSLDRPELCGGINDVIRGVWAVQKKIDWKKLLEYAEIFRTKAALKRLGFIMELFGLTPEHTKNIAGIALRSKSYILFDPTGKKEGDYLSRWRLQMNVNIDELKESVWG